MTACTLLLTNTTTNGKEKGVSQTGQEMRMAWQDGNRGNETTTAFGAKKQLQDEGAVAFTGR